MLLVPAPWDGIGHDFGVVLGWHWVVLGGVGAHLVNARQHGRNVVPAQLNRTTMFVYCNEHALAIRSRWVSEAGPLRGI